MKKKIINEKNNNSTKIKPKNELIKIINELNESIRIYFNSTRQIIVNYKKNHVHLSNDIINIEKMLFIFIKSAKDLFSRMRDARKQFLEEEFSKKNQGQLYNYCNNNFFYYSNAPTNLNTNSNFFTKINHGFSKKISYKSPSNKNHNFSNISNNKIINHNSIQNSYKKLNKDISKLFSNDNSISKDINSNNIIIPRLKLEKDTNKDELLENILNLLKQLKQFKCKIFYETEEARKYKNIFDTILGKLNKLIKILSTEKIESNHNKCLTERKQRNSRSKEQNNILKNTKKYENILRNIENFKKSSIHLRKINKSCSNNSNYFNTRNPFNQKTYFLSIQNLKSRNESLQEKKKKAMSFNITEKKEDRINSLNKPNANSIRDILIKEGINEYNLKKEQDSKFMDKEQQTDNIIIEKDISQLINIFIESDSLCKKRKLDKEELMKELENKVDILTSDNKKLKEKILNLENENNTYKNIIEKKTIKIDNLSKEIDLLKQYIEKQENKEKDEQNNHNSNIELKNNNNNEELKIDLDKISIKYELLKLDYDRQKVVLQEKEKLLNNYNHYADLNDSKVSEEKINQLIKTHENEIEELNQKYTKNILELKINLPNCFSTATHTILVDKKFKQFNLHWYLLTVTSTKKKDYENTFWVSEDEIKSTLKDFNTFKTEEDIEKENINVYITAQQKFIKRIEINEDIISSLKKQIQKLKGEK